MHGLSAPDSSAYGKGVFHFWLGASCTPKDVPFTSSAATGPGAEVSFKKRPFGILRYTPGEGGKGAMVQEVIGKSRYPGDPQGQAGRNQTR